MAAQIVAIGDGAPVKARLLGHQPVGVILDTVLLAMLVLNLAQEQFGVVVAILERAAMRRLSRCRRS